MFDFIQHVIWDWGVRCFGIGHMKDRKVRGVRYLEEAAELMQALGVTQDQCNAVVNTVYSRPAGDLHQEIGGSFVTLLALCTCLGYDPLQLLQIEVHRCLSKSPEHFAKRNQEKLDRGLTG